MGHTPFPEPGAPEIKIFFTGSEKKKSFDEKKVPAKGSLLLFGGAVSYMYAPTPAAVNPANVPTTAIFFLVLSPRTREALAPNFRKRLL